LPADDFVAPSRSGGLDGLVLSMNKAVRRQGRIIAWKDAEEFGFIGPDGGGEEVFAHISAFAGGQRRPSLNDRVAFEQSRDRKGRLRAVNIEILFANRWSLGLTGALLAVAVFMIALIACVLDRKLPLLVFLIYVLLSLVAPYVYAADKKAAKSSRPRVAESTLHWLSLSGGWPGALIAQQSLRHKNSKWSFQWKFWACVLTNLAGLTALMLAPMARPLRTILSAVLG